MKLVKQQVNGKDRVVLKENANLEDLRQEAMRLRSDLGYDVMPDGGINRYLASHKFYRGRFLLRLEPD